MLHWKQATESLTNLVRQSRLGLFSDLDGTLAPIAPTPAAAQISPRAGELLAALRDRLPLVALISGRRAASLQAKVGIPGLVYIGNHGLENWVDGKTVLLPQALPFLPHLQAVKTELQALEQPGVYVEDKEATLSFHYRQAADPAEFAAQHAPKIESLVAKHGLALFTGKMVFEIRPPIEMDKGVAFSNLVEQHQLDAALFLGDDVSDLNTLRMARKLRESKRCEAWGVGVQSAEAPEDLAAAADFFAGGVDDVEDLLAWLLRAREASAT